MGKTYFVDSGAAGRSGSGLSPDAAAASWRELDIQPGDEVLFRRGSVFRDALLPPNGTQEAPIRFGANGEGEKPAFLGSADASDPACWQETAPNVWQCMLPLESEVGNLIFNGGESCGILAWEESGLNAQGKWHDTRIGLHSRAVGKPVPGALSMYSEGNPGEVYRHIECALYGARRMCSATAYVTFEDLAFRYSGVHGFAATDAKGVEVRRCDFDFIGGVVWDRDLKIRFGNAFELWNGGSDIAMEDCACYEVYDSCFTHQGPGDDCRLHRNLRVTGNRFEKYGMAAYEARDKVPLGVTFADNVCLGAGLGFAMQDETPPRRSEIWPQPMGHHLFIWRMPRATEGGWIDVRGNTFGAAPYGSAVYSIVSPEAEGQFTFSENRWGEDGGSRAHWGGADGFGPSLENGGDR